MNQFISRVAGWWSRNGVQVALYLFPTMAIISYGNFHGKIGEALFYQRCRLDFAEDDIKKLRARVFLLEKKDN